MNATPPLYFCVIVWGAEHRGYLHDLLIASLLSPRNLPALDNGEICRFLVCTTAEDWAALEAQPLFARLRRLIPTEFVALPASPEALAAQDKMLFMSKAHRVLSQIAFGARAYGVFLTPDLVLSDGSVARLQELARAGKDVVLCAALRFAHEGCLAAFVRSGAMRAGEPMTLSGRALMSVALSNLHSETIRYEWDADFFADVPVAAYWWAPDRRGIVLHCFSWAPLLVNYGALAIHDTSAFETWTLDGDYVFANFGDDLDRVHVVTDSDEIALVSFTKEADLSLPRYPYWLFRIPIVGDAVKVINLKRFWNSTAIDPLKRRIFSFAVRWHGDGVDPSWAPVERRAARLVGRSSRPMTALERKVAPFLLYYIRFIIPWAVRDRYRMWRSRLRGHADQVRGRLFRIASKLRRLARG